MPEIARHNPEGHCSNASWKFAFGLLGWPGNEPLGGEAIKAHFKTVSEIAAPDVYILAYGRWKSGLQAKNGQSQGEELKVSPRLFIGMSEPSVFETAITLNPLYGVPYITGPACKGLTSRIALQSGIASNVCNTLFGNTDEATGQGVVIFHDAWWVPNSAPVPPNGNRAHSNHPLVPEVVTPHHPEFQNSRGKNPATPFDNPTPIPLLAAHGKFFFAIEGPKLWATFALDLLKLGLKEEGIGARTPEYGTFS